MSSSLELRVLEGLINLILGIVDFRIEIWIKTWRRKSSTSWSRWLVGEGRSNFSKSIILVVGWKCLLEVEVILLVHLGVIISSLNLKEVLILVLVLFERIYDLWSHKFDFIFLDSFTFWNYLLLSPILLLNLILSDFFLKLNAVLYPACCSIGLIEGVIVWGVVAVGRSEGDLIIQSLWGFKLLTIISSIILKSWLLEAVRLALVGILVPDFWIALKNILEVFLARAILALIALLLHHFNRLRLPHVLGHQVLIKCLFASLSFFRAIIYHLCWEKREYLRMRHRKELRRQLRCQMCQF